MKFVKTSRAFAQETFHIEDRGYYQNEFVTMAIRFLYGAEVNGKTFSKPQKEWRFQMIDTIPNYYVKAGRTTPELAYDFGKKLIDACYKQNRIMTYNYLNQAEKELYRIFRDLISESREILKAEHRSFDELSLKVELPNTAISLEAYAEDIYEFDIRSLQYDSKYWDETDRKIKSCEADREFTDGELSYYCRAFQVSAPEWFISQYNRKCVGHRKDSSSYTIWAQCPTISGRSQASYSSDYAGNLEADGSRAAMAPYSILRDSTPKKLHVDNRQLLVDSVNFYLNLPEDEQATFLADSFRIIDGKVVEVDRDTIEQEELDLIQDVIHGNAYFWQDANGNVHKEAWA